MSRLSGLDIQICVRERDNRLWVSWSGPAFSRVRDSYRAAFPSHTDAGWLPEERCWSMPLARRQRLEQWLSQAVDAAAVQWVADDVGDGDEATGSRSYTRSKSSYRRYDGPRHRRGDDRGVLPALEQAYARLCLTPEAPAELVTTVHHWWTRRLHPDAGGDIVLMAEVNAAVDTIRADNERSA